MNVPDTGRLTDLPGVEPGGELAMPTDDDIEPVEEIVDAELVEEDDQPVQTPVRRSRDITVRVVGRLAHAPRSEQARRAGRGVTGAAVTVLQGWHSWLVRAWDGLTLGVYRQQIRIAQATGDAEALAAWMDRRQHAADRRHAKLMELPLLVVGLAKATAFIVAGVIVLLLVVSILVAGTGAGEFGDVWAWAAGVVRWLISALHLAWSVLVVALPALLLLAGWREGRRRAEPPRWLVKPQEQSEGRQVVPDEGAILEALRNLPIAPLNKAFKAGWRARVVLPTQRDGKGYRTQLQLPPGVTVEMITQKKKVLAHNLVRHAVEVWPTEPKTQPGILDLWVADQGSLSGPVPAWPLLTEGTTDYFKGVPLTIDIRGDVVFGRLFEANYAVAGMMGSGKSTLIITLLLGAMLDPLVVIDTFVLATNADYDPMRPRLATLLAGPGDDVVAACMDTLRDIHADLTIRGQALQEHGERAVNRNLAEKDERLRPRIVVVDECQGLFMHPLLGEEAADLAVKTISVARKYAVTFVWATPEPSSTSLPRRLMAVTSNKACFAIGDQRSNDAILGTGSYKAGISAVDLEPKTAEGPGDIGTCMARGFQSKPGLLRSYYIAKGSGVDEVTPVVERALKLQDGLSSARRALGGGLQVRDLLADVDTVMGVDPVPVADLPALLARLAPSWLPYRSLTGKELRAQLSEMGVKVPSTGNRWPVSPQSVREALARRERDE
ncbi:hypothetical protein [Nonomuraea sediminis]|uniref:hypothetical protein n=1 Tax=Nonomuraea sediminis TaxID=2835864 RepID=UPI001BDD561F|nr:hypothetical protein [Nonomuraea sediminis]